MRHCHERTRHVPTPFIAALWTTKGAARSIRQKGAGSGWGVGRGRGGRVAARGKGRTSTRAGPSMYRRSESTNLPARCVCTVLLWHRSTDAPWNVPRGTCTMPSVARLHVVRCTLSAAMLRVAMQTAALSRRCYLSWVDAVRQTLIFVHDGHTPRVDRGRMATPKQRGSSNGTVNRSEK